MNFDEAFERLIGHEGGYINHPKDLGGETKYGISRRSYPGEDIPGMTLERAKTIYLRDYWGPAGCDVMPAGARLQVFDTAVNSGVRVAIRMIQRAVGVVDDGILGSHTLQALQSMPASRFVARFNGQRLAHFADLATFPAFGRGWVRRIAENLMEV